MRIYVLYNFCMSFVRRLIFDGLSYMYLIWMQQCVTLNNQQTQIIYKYIAYIQIKTMKQKQFNEFDMYERLRSYQLHWQRMQKQKLEVPTHQAYSPTKPTLSKAKQYHRNKHINKIEHQNQHIMHKLININQRKPHYSSAPSLSLPPIKRNQFQIPLHEEQNSILAKKIITSKPSISLREQVDRYRTVEERKRRISKFDSNSGVSINRKKHLAQLLFLKKLKNSRVLNPEI